MLTMFYLSGSCPAPVLLHASTVAGEDGMHLCEGQIAGERKAGRNWERDGPGLQAPGIPYRTKRSKCFVS